jgi:restriction system protein
MSIPDFQTLMLPVLRYASSVDEHSLREATEFLADEFSLTTEEREELLTSGRQPVFYNRVGWARTYLKKSGLLETSRRGYLKLTDRGKEILESNPSRIDMSFLRQFPEYIEFRERRRETKEIIQKIEEASDLTPEEALEDAYQKIRDDLAQELLDQVKECSASFFENLVLDLLVKMGYGGSRIDAARAVGRKGDEGIDGIIDEDRLGLDSIYIQAKKWSDTSIGRPDIQRFVGALGGKRAKKGIFITTSTFTDTAQKYVSNIDVTVVLIDGKRLSELMIDFDIGVSPISIYEIKRLDSDYFSDL